MVWDAVSPGAGVTGIINHLMLYLETELWSSAREVSALSYQATSPGLKSQTLA